MRFEKLLSVSKNGEANRVKRGVFMNILLQNMETQGFLVDDGSWVTEKKLAKVFPNGLSAYDYCRKHGLSRMQIVMTFGDYDFDVNIPVREPAPARPAASFAQAMMSPQAMPQATA